MPPYSISFTFWERSFLFLFGFPVTHDVQQNRKLREGFKRLVEVAAEYGFGEYRTAPAYQDSIMSTYSFNNHALLRSHETLKDAVDPNGIFAGALWDLAEGVAEGASMKKYIAALLLATVSVGATAEAADGQQVYEKWCAPCHAPGPDHPGTQALDALYRGSKPGALIERTDLTPPIVKQFVRKGVSVMPFFRKTEISDTELDALAAFLSKQK